ncbi:AbgT family transporter [Planococcus sp. ANT_H30]|uniref:Aminobenzoyl-glutamate transporter n=3 Tax=Caryophanaceae TaxID=186818 RepID=A0ABM5X0Y1_9BACL|nr:aminobenzoyl-glutamate transporter [Planococcus kocurii]AQU81039.1 aminobenzoyl-glutamate transporter [Planococcus faecalis]KAA0955216.1 AbgT family transporter [Planococcus sp. ANT_H30]
MLTKVEVYGNKMPDPVTLFASFTLIILVASAIFSSLGITSTHPGTGEEIQVVNMLNGDGIRTIFETLVPNFTGFPPLGLVLVVMLGVGLAESTGLVTTFMKTTILNAPAKVILPTILLIAVLGNTAADAAQVVLPPIAAMIFAALGRNPIAGLVAGYATVTGAFSANLIVSMLDPLLSGFTQAGANLIDPSYVANPAINWYFMIASTFVIIPVSMFVTTKITEPRLGVYTGKVDKLEKTTTAEKRGLLWAGIALALYAVVILLLVLPENGILRNQETGGIIVSPFMTGIVPIMLFGFLLPALAYGFGSKVLKNDKDVAEHLTKAMSGMGGYIVLAFVAAQMIAFFGMSNLGPIIAIEGAGFLKGIGFEGLPLILGFIMIAALINLLIASASAKWALLAPIFVPMFMMLGYDPAVTQVAYRIADSITNPITPMLAYFAILLTFAKKYDKNIGIGTLLAALLPYSIAFAIFWLILFTVWFLLGLPLGPGGNIYLP